MHCHRSTLQNVYHEEKMDHSRSQEFYCLMLETDFCSAPPFCISRIGMESCSGCFPISTVNFVKSREMRPCSPTILKRCCMASFK